MPRQMNGKVHSEVADANTDIQKLNYTVQHVCTVLFLNAIRLLVCTIYSYTRTRHTVTISLLLREKFYSFSSQYFCRVHRVMVKLLSNKLMMEVKGE